MTPSYDVMILGGGPGGYVAAIRAAQLSLKAAVVEREHLGGVCLNWGCIPTKALLRNAEIARLVTGGGKEFGFTAENVTLDYAAAVERSRKISARLVKGVELLMQSHAIDVLWGVGRLTSPTTVEIAAKDGVQTLEAPHIILATGSRARLIPGVEADGETILTARLRRHHRRGADWIRIRHDLGRLRRAGDGGGNARAPPAGGRRGRRQGAGPVA